MNKTRFDYKIDGISHSEAVTTISTREFNSAFTRISKIADPNSITCTTV